MVPDPRVAAISENTEPEVPPARNVLYPYRTGLIIISANFALLDLEAGDK